MRIETYLREGQDEKQNLAVDYKLDAGISFATGFDSDNWGDRR